MPRSSRTKPRSRGRHSRRPAGVTLLELIVATMILAIASLGALTYQYHAVKQARSARAEIAAAQLAQLLLDDWKSTGGNEFYDPTKLDLGLEQIGTEPLYRIVFNGFPMQARLWYTDLDSNVEAGVTLREIRVTIRWRRDYKNLEPSAADPIFTSSTYVRRDQSGG